MNSTVAINPSDYAKEPYDNETLSFTYSAWSPDGSEILSDNGWGYSGNGIEDAEEFMYFPRITVNYTQ